jgi:hypothetical protein
MLGFSVSLEVSASPLYSFKILEKDYIYDRQDYAAAVPLKQDQQYEVQRIYFHSGCALSLVQVFLQPLFLAYLPLADDTRAKSWFPIHVCGTTGVRAGDYTIERGVGRFAKV